MPDLHFFIGKDGVGKTTLAAAYAVRRAAQQPRKPILLISADPAHPLANIFQLRLGDHPQALRVPEGGQLSVVADQCRQTI